MGNEVSNSDQSVGWVPESVVKRREAEAWKQGKRAGSSRAMRMMSDEPNLELDIPNPYLTEER